MRRDVLRQSTIYECVKTDAVDNAMMEVLMSAVLAGFPYNQEYTIMAEFCVRSSRSTNAAKVFFHKLMVSLRPLGEEHWCKALATFTKRLREKDEALEEYLQRHGFELNWLTPCFYNHMMKLGLDRRGIASVFNLMASLIDEDPEPAIERIVDDTVEFVNFLATRLFEQQHDDPCSILEFMSRQKEWQDFAQLGMDTTEEFNQIMVLMEGTDKADMEDRVLFGSDRSTQEGSDNDSDIEIIDPLDPLQIQMLYYSLDGEPDYSNISDWVLQLHGYSYVLVLMAGTVSARLGPNLLRRGNC